ncbi:hypothetical protein ONZ51_g4473 [Trametes cubensis]|uniref:DUF7223 domain-containing protein n=1 Tax=Trametes cubensis TaxID=1111947 RepID=A0AAD7TVZ7_9APHY|nr:hypothetical protein ONZ51_g4473 [Trametes cubensis]
MRRSHTPRIVLIVYSLILHCVSASVPIKSHSGIEPCFGRCKWTIDSSMASGILHIVGPDAAVSDITPSAGWAIIDCNLDAPDQDIRLVCQNASRGCAHVYQNGAQGTLVRLPENCGPKSFAIVTREWTHDNQSVPEHLELVRREDAPPAVVKGMTLTTSFKNVNSTRHGAVNLALIGSSVPGIVNGAAMEPLGDTGKDSLRSWASGSLHALAQEHADLSLSVGTLNKSKTGASPINFSKKISLYQQNMSCPQSGKRPAFTGKFSVSVEPSVNGNVSYGVTAVGSIIPPRLDEFGFFVGLDATVATILAVDASLTGSLSSGSIPLVSVGLPGLSFPGILDIGPTFDVNAIATASLDTYLNLSASLAYDIQGMQITFMSGSHSQTGNITLGKMSGVQLSASPSVTSHGQLTAHLIPSIAFGISAFDNKVQTTASLNFDAETSLDLSLSGSLGLAAPTGQCRRRMKLGFNGCANLTSGFSVNAGVNADFFDVFKKGKSVQFFKKDFDLYEVRISDVRVPLSLL